MIETLLLIDEDGDPLRELPPFDRGQQPHQISLPILLLAKDVRICGTATFEIDSLSQNGEILRYRRTEVKL